MLHFMCAFVEARKFCLYYVHMNTVAQFDSEQYESSTDHLTQANYAHFIT